MAGSASRGPLSLVDHQDLPSELPSGVALVVDEVGRVGGHGPVDPAVLVLPARLAGLGQGGEVVLER